MRSLLKTLALPPAVLFLLALVGLVVRKRFPRLARGLVSAAVLLGYALSTPLLSAVLERGLETYPALDPRALGDPATLGGAEAIVVLSGDIQTEAPEYRGPGVQGETLGELTLQRLRYGAFLQRATGLPLCVTGGKLRHGTESVAEIMRRTLEDEFGVPVRWVEPRAATTWQNAQNVARLFEHEGLELPVVLLVTHAWHMPRAVSSFEAAGLRVVPAPTDFRARPRFELAEILPSAKALRDSSFALHEWLGRAWYALFPGR